MENNAQLKLTVRLENRDFLKWHQIQACYITNRSLQNEELFGTNSRSGRYPTTEKSLIKAAGPTHFLLQPLFPTITADHGVGLAHCELSGSYSLWTKEACCTTHTLEGGGTPPKTSTELFPAVASRATLLLNTGIWGLIGLGLGVLGSLSPIALERAGWITPEKEITLALF